jgi:hypothetical protein
VPSSERHGSPASAAAWYTISDLPTPGGESSRKLCWCAIHAISVFAWRKVIVSSSGLDNVVARARPPEAVVAVVMIAIVSENASDDK